MKFSENWLREWVNPNVDTATLVHQLTMAGLEVDEVKPFSVDFKNVCVGRITHIEQHPNADRLKVCTVDIGADTPLTIVCGGKNARADLNVAVAIEGAVLPGGFKIKKTKLRGVPSAGMLCSSSELGLPEGDVADGIMELPDNAPIGRGLKDYLKLHDDHVLDVDLTPNRGDCLSIQGIAREVAAINQLPLNKPSILPIKSLIEEAFPIEIEATQACPHYVGRVIKGINAYAKTPAWMEERLVKSNLRSIHPIVDITNYVMLELGQPLHAFDLDKLSEKIWVRKAKEGETLTLLDEQTLTLTAQTLVIADSEKAHAMAGIMGGSESGVVDSTQDIFLESAFFDPILIVNSVQHYNIHTDSSHRFERGVDYALQVDAIERATQLILDIAGGKPGPVQVKRAEKAIPQPVSINLRRNQITRMLGQAISDEQVEALLQSLGLKVKPMEQAASLSCLSELSKETKHPHNGPGWEVEVPSYRFDLSLEVDLIEELARLFGYNHIPENKQLTHYMAPTIQVSQEQLRKACQFLAAQGYYETINYSFIAQEEEAWVSGDINPIVLANPISKDLSTMRSSLWPGLLKSVVYNLNRQQESIRLFETGLCFKRKGEGYLQLPKLAGAATGDFQPEQWLVKKRPFDFYDIKGLLEGLFTCLHLAPIDYVKAEHPMLHPGKTASLLCQDGKSLGFIGALHPTIMRQLKLTKPVYLFELDVILLESKVEEKTLTPVSKFPQIRRDISFIIDKKVPWEEVRKKIQKSSSKCLNKIDLFDIYEGGSIEQNKCSVALALTYQSETETLQDEDINKEQDKIIALLKNEFGVSLRN